MTVILIVGNLFSITIFADVVNPPVAVNSSLPEPVPVYQVTGNSVHIEIFAVRQSSSNGVISTYLYQIVIDGPVGTYGYYARGGNDHAVLSSVNFGSMSNYQYDLDGNLIQGQTRNTSTTTAQGFNYLAYLWNGNWPSSGFVYLFLPNQVTLYDSGYLYPSDFVSWSQVPTIPTVYHSSLPLPVADEYNRYFIFGDGVDCYLLWFSFQEFEYQYINSGNPTNHLTSDIWSETVVISTSGASYSMIFKTPTALNDISYMSYVLMITMYDMSTGQYIRSSMHADQTVGQTITISLSDFIDTTNISDCCVYGINCLVDSIPLNRSSIIYSVDPDFITWRNQVLNYLMHIYEILTEQGTEITMDRDTSSLDEMQSAVDGLVVTDGQGNNIDAADQASIVFSQAEGGINDLAEPINKINTEIVSNVFFEPILFIPIVVSLTLGLLITILGKNKSD